MSVEEPVKKLFTKFDKLQTRERILLVVATLFVLVAGIDQMLLLPNRTEGEVVQEAINEANSKITMNKVLKEQFEAQIAIDPNAREQMRLARLKQEMTQLDTELAKHSLALISPQQMVQVLRDVVNNDHRLELISMRSLGGTPVLEARNTQESADTAVSADEIGPQMPNIYRHGLEMTFKGEYFAVILYLKKLEALQWRFYWDSVQIQMQRYPIATVTVRLDTLSFVNAWIGT